MYPHDVVRRLALTGLCTLAAGIAATPPAHAASVQVNLGPGQPTVAVDTTQILGTVGGIVGATVGGVGATVNQVTNGVVAPAVDGVGQGVVAPTLRLAQGVVQGTGVTTYVILDGAGRVLRGPGVVSVNNRRGLVSIGWASDYRGCTQVAVSNTLTRGALKVDVSTPLVTRVTSRSNRARASLRNITVAVIC